MADVTLEVLGDALNKDTDDGRVIVYRMVGDRALFICAGGIELPIDRLMATRDRTGSGFARSPESEPVLEKVEYVHTKGGVYVVRGVALRTDTLRENDWWVVYQPQSDRETGEMFVRSYGNFTEPTENGEPRFRPKIITAA